jgi:hypothetical protein
VAEHSEGSVSFASSRRPRSANRTLTRPSADSRAFGSTSLLGNLAQPAEVAQARVFERLLQSECAELQELAHRAAGGDELEAGDLKQIRARLDEVDGLLRALQGRFPRSASDGDR